MDRRKTKTGSGKAEAVIARERPGASEVEAKASNLKASRRPTPQKRDGGWHGESTGNRRHVLPASEIRRRWRDGIASIWESHRLPAIMMNEGWEQQALGFRTLPGDSKYFGDAGKQCVLNFRVRDLDAMMAQPECCRNRRGTRSRTLSEWAVRPLIRRGRHCH